MDDESAVDEPTDCRAEIARLRDEVDEWRRELRDQIGDVEWRLATLAFAFREPRRFGLDALLIAMHQTTEQIGQTKLIIAHGLQYLATGHSSDQSGRRETHAQLIASATREGYDPTEVEAYLEQRPGPQAERLSRELLETDHYSGLDGLVAFIADALRVHPSGARDVVEAHRAAGIGPTELYDVLDPPDPGAGRQPAPTGEARVMGGEAT